MFMDSIRNVRKTGTKITIGEIENDDGTIIRRIKSASINAYEIEKDEEIKRYDSFGRNMPDEVLNTLGCRLMDIDGDGLNLNISPQISLPFLLKESPVFRMKVLNKLTGNDILDSVVQSFNKDNLKISRESKVLEEDKEDKEKIYSEELIKLTEINEKYIKAKETIRKFSKA